MQYMLHSNMSCPDCPRNEQPRSLDEISCRLLDLASEQHVGTFREILPFKLVQPEQDFEDPTNARARQLAAQVLSLYAGYNLNVILAFDCPLPAWMGVSAWCPIPQLANTTAWSELKNTLSYTIAHFVAWLATPGPAGGGLDRNWLHTHFLLEPWNEFDAVADADCKKSKAPSAERAADLQGGVTFALKATGAFVDANMPVQIMPSVTGSQGSWSKYVASYYAVGGTGYPSTHWYGCDVQALEAHVTEVEAVLPAQYKGQHVLGETGCALVTQDCPTGGTMALRTAFLRGLANSPVLNSACRDVLFWRVMALANTSSLGCDATFGVTMVNNTFYDAAGRAFFQAVGGTGISKQCSG
jgi:hypothetical protein